MNDSGYAVTEIREGVFRLQFGMPYGVQDINVYLLAGEPVTLIDTGPVIGGIPDALYAALAEVGHPAPSLEQIVITHHHPDHMGLAARLKAGGGARVACHELGSSILSDLAAERVRLREYMAGLATFIGLDPELMRASLFKPSEWDAAAEPVTPDLAVPDGAVVRAGSRDLEVLHTPGHTIDHICLYDPEERIMFTGDMLLQSITPNPDVYPPWQSDKQSGLPDYIASLNRIRGFGTSIALPGHGGTITDFEGRIDDVLLHHSERLRFLRDEINDEEKTVFQLALVLLESINAEMSNVNVFLAMREVFGHLVILEQAGTVRMKLKEGTGWYRAV